MILTITVAPPCGEQCDECGEGIAEGDAVVGTVEDRTVLCGACAVLYVPSILFGA